MFIANGDVNCVSPWIINCDRKTTLSETLTVNSTNSDLFSGSFSALAVSHAGFRASLITSPTFYTAVPTGCCKGYVSLVIHTLSVSVTGNTGVTVCIIALTFGMWMVFGDALTQITQFPMRIDVL